jgi:hypothetical protein
MSEPVIPDVPAGGAVPPWAAVGVQLLEALLQRLKADDPGAPPGGPTPHGPSPRSAAPQPAHLERTCRLLSRRNERLALALGACRCWGRSPACRRCGGQGRPGSLDVDPDAFAEVVLPLLQAQPELFLRHVAPAVEVVPEQ